MVFTERSKGFLCGIIAAVTYGLNPLFAKPLYKAGLTPDNVLFYRYLFALAGLVLMVKLNGSSFRFKKKELPWLLLNGVMMFLSSLFLFLSYEVMDVGIASTLLFVYPVMIALIMTLGFRGEALAAIASVKRELGGKWAAGVVLLQCGVAWIFALLTRLLCLAVF